VTTTCALESAVAGAGRGPADVWAEERSRAERASSASRNVALSGSKQRRPMNEGSDMVASIRDGRPSARAMRGLA
jgi:hypothetical protein